MCQLQVYAELLLEDGRCEYECEGLEDNILRSPSMRQSESLSSLEQYHGTSKLDNEAPPWPDRVFKLFRQYDQLHCHHPLSI